ncbi:hypothetical protein Nepgr_023547 [Nepenthes gracilis]|uniref:Thioesterase domain-containing protein n=1 Tax=Nepenthes gracilis TaxID=150966 RepID=A0AAD3XZ77_NEPGR|nr:hypothetical protein Nepgr_023547 [Nepenthes gracilis]
MDANQDNAPNPKAATIISKEMPEEHVTLVFKFLTASGYSGELPEGCSAMDFFSDLIRGLLKVDCITRGRITCSFSVKPAIVNNFKGLHGGVVAAIAERVAVACARTVVAEDKELFLGELNMSYLSAAPLNFCNMIWKSKNPFTRQIIKKVVFFTIEIKLWPFGLPPRPPSEISIQGESHCTRFNHSLKCKTLLSYISTSKKQKCQKMFIHRRACLSYKTPCTFISDTITNPNYGHEPEGMKSLKSCICRKFRPIKKLIKFTLI